MDHRSEPRQSRASVGDSANVQAAQYVSGTSEAHAEHLALPIRGLQYFSTLLSRRRFLLAAVNRLPSMPSENECGICADSDSRESALHIRKCGHIFHEKCVTTWFEGEAVNHNKCPYCRTPLFAPELRSDTEALIHSRQEHIGANRPSTAWGLQQDGQATRASAQHATVATPTLRIQATSNNYPNVLQSTDFLRMLAEQDSLGRRFNELASTHLAHHSRNVELSRRVDELESNIARIEQHLRELNHESTALRELPYTLHAKLRQLKVAIERHQWPPVARVRLPLQAEAAVSGSTAGRDRVLSGRVAQRSAGRSHRSAQASSTAAAATGSTAPQSPSGAHQSA